MTNKPRTLDKRTKAAQIKALVIEGKSNEEIAGIVGCSRQAIWDWRKRHAAEIEQAQAQVEKHLEDYAIAHKVNRIAGLDALARQVQAWIDERGLMERSEITTENAVIVRERFAREVPAELRAIYHAAAEETDQLPRGTTIQDNRVQILIEQVKGVDPERLR